MRRARLETRRHSRLGRFELSRQALGAAKHGQGSAVKPSPAHPPYSSPSCSSDGEVTRGRGGGGVSGRRESRAHPHLSALFTRPHASAAYIHCNCPHHHPTSHHQQKKNVFSIIHAHHAAVHSCSMSTRCAGAKKTCGSTVFSTGHPRQYSLAPAMLVCADRTRRGMFIAVWPQMKFTCQCSLHIPLATTAHFQLHIAIALHRRATTQPHYYNIIFTHITNLSTNVVTVLTNVECARLHACVLVVTSRPIEQQGLCTVHH